MTMKEFNSENIRKDPNPYWPKELINSLEKLHPTTGNSCRDCKWCKLFDEGIDYFPEGYCTHPKADIENLYGLRIVKKEGIERCGIEGKWFEPRKRD